MTNLSSSPYRKRLSRRTMLALAAGFSVFAGALALSAINPGDAEAQRAVAAPSVPVDALMKAGPLPELVYGNADAKITIVEYAALTCPHCADFHKTVFPKLKAKYIDTGKAKLVFREFPLKNVGAGAAMLARCAGDGSGNKTLKMIDILLTTQSKWAFARSGALPALFAIARQFGFTQASFDKCLADQKLLDALTQSRGRASKEFGVNTTPHFFINGKRLNGSSLKAFEKEIDPLL